MSVVATRQVGGADPLLLLGGTLGCIKPPKPAGIVPATRVRSGEQVDRPASKDWIEQAAAKVERNSAGFLVGVQGVAQNFSEDVALALTAALEAHFWQPPDSPARPPL